jgi:hypothetical protein
MHASLLLRVWIFDKGDLGISFQISDLRQLDVVVDSLSIDFEMEARILKSAGELDDGLTEILHLFLARNLLFTLVSGTPLFLSWGGIISHHHLNLIWLVR